MLNFLFSQRSLKLFLTISPYLKKRGIILDFGAGDGLLAQRLHDEGFKVMPVDIKNRNKSSLKLTLYDGRKLPFQDDFFESTIVNFVLFLNPVSYQDLIYEVKRTTRVHILIIEDTPESHWEFLLKKLWGLVLYRKWNLLFLPKHRWLTIFKKSGLKIIKTKKVYIKLLPFLGFHQTLFYLEKR